MAITAGDILFKLSIKTGSATNSTALNNDGVTVRCEGDTAA